MSRLNRILDISQQPINLTFVSSYIPRKCGIATFTKDLITAINDLNPHSPVKVVAMNEEAESRRYPHEVRQIIERDDPESYADAARTINNSSSEIVCLQHEYGLFGGDAGEHLFKLLERIRQPIVTTLHTVLEKPTELQRDVLFRVAKLSEAVVVMTPEGRERLERQYGINPDKVAIIHHGVMDQPRSVRASKERFGWQDERILLMSGLMNHGKGVEYVIEALPAIKAKIPNVRFVYVGETHPDIIRQEGTTYLETLRAKVAELNLQESVTFIDSYLPLNELLAYYDAADIYLTPHLDSQQIASGTLAYAIGMGKACVSTPFVYAREMLANGAGAFARFADSGSIARSCLQILSDPEYQDSLETKAYAVGRRMSWPLVAERYLILFRIVQEYNGSIRRS